VRVVVRGTVFCAGYRTGPARSWKCGVLTRDASAYLPVPTYALNGPSNLSMTRTTWPWPRSTSIDRNDGSVTLMLLSARHAPRRPRGGTLSRPSSQESRALTRTLCFPEDANDEKGPDGFFSVVSFGRHDPDALTAHVAVSDAATPWSCMICRGLVTASRSPAPRRCCCCCIGSPKRNAPSREKKKRKKRNTKENQK
jgi:hypothetical protein